MKQINYLLLFVIALLLCFVSVPTPQCVISVSPAGVVVGGAYSGVMFDLQSDKNFDVDKYPVIDNDYSLSLITLAENLDNELFVYVYQPAGKVKATSVNISVEDGESKDFKNYKLSMISNSGVFYKYRVTGLSVTDSHRYEVSSIFRKYISNVDEDVDNGNSVSEVPYAVGKLFVFTNGKLSVSDVEYITITDKYVGYVRYYGGSYILVNNSCDSHFVAFSTDKQIDKIIEADVYFQTRRFEKRVDLAGEHNKWLDDEEIDEYRYLTEDDETAYVGNGFWKHSYRWDRIQSVDEFLESQDFTNAYQGALLDESVEYKMDEESAELIRTKQWVLRFFESEYKYEYYAGIGTGYSSSTTTMTRVFNVSILRLKFETDGVVYDLGVVDTKQSGKETPDNVIEKISYSVNDNVKGTLKMIFGILLLIIVLVICAPILPVVFNFIAFLIKAILKAIGKFFSMIGNLFKRKK